ncbi:MULTISPECIES: ArsR/SmtB family transcription factor [Brevibacterium]|nr:MULTISPECIES: metalloregulator ArsR/SmtB family transcription factor [Brevibacterium]
MKTLSDDQADALFHALSDRTRRDIVRRVMDEGQSVSTLAAKYDMSFAAVQKHVAVLERAGLVNKRRRGREQVARTDVGTIRSAQELLGELEHLWRERVERIDDLLAADGGSTGSTDRAEPSGAAGGPPVS